MSIPANKKCCDCGEPVAANVDVTHGIFVCTACSGIHREFGDRIKSVSMAQFTQDELNILQNQNNDTFNDQWLAKFNSATDRGIVPSSNDNQRRAFLIAKYQEKRWFAGNASTRRRSQQQVNPFGGQSQQQANPFAQQQPTNPFGGQSQQPPKNPFGNQLQQTQQQTQQQQWSPFGNQPQQPAAQSNPFASKPAQPQQQTNPFNKNTQGQQQQQQQWSPFGNQPQQSQQQQPAQQSQAYDDLLDLDFNNPSNPQYQKVQKMQEQHNELKGLVGLVDDPSPNSVNGQPNINALRESGLGAPQGSNINMTTLTMAGFGQFTMNPGVIPNMGQPMGGAYPNAGGYGMAGGMGGGYPNAGGYGMAGGMGGGYQNTGFQNNAGFQPNNQYNNFNRH